MKLSYPYSPVIVLLYLAFFSCGSREASPPLKGNPDSTSNNVALNEEQFRNAGIRVGRVEQRSLHGIIKANGVLDVPPQNLVTVSAPLGGFVKNTDLLQGMKVQKGQLIVTLEHPDYIQLQQDYLDLSSQLVFLQQEYLRQESLARENVNAEKTLQLARSNYNSTKARVQGLQARLRMINIDPGQLEKGTISSTIHMYAPITGFVSQVNVNIGMHVSPTDVMFRIIDNSHLHAEAQVFEKDVARLKIGQAVRFTLSSDSRERKASVYLIGKEITADHMVRVHCHLEEEDPSLIPGLYFSAIIETENQTGSALPQQAIVTFGNKSYFFLVTDEAHHHYAMTEIKTGNSENGYVEVLLPVGFDPVAQVVVQGAYELLGFLKNVNE